MVWNDFESEVIQSLTRIEERLDILQKAVNGLHDDNAIKDRQDKEKRIRDSMIDNECSCQEQECRDEADGYEVKNPAS